MLSFRQLDDLPDAVVQSIAAAEREIIDDMARRIAKLGRVSDATAWQISRLEAIGTTQERILQSLSAALNITEPQLAQLFDEAATRTLAADDKLYKAAGYEPVPLAQNAYMQQIIRAGLQKTQNEYRNLTLTTAATATQQFERALDLAYSKIVSGGVGYQQAIRAGIQELTRNGLATIQYPSGHRDYLDTAFRRATLTGVSQTAAELQLRRMDELDTDLVETTAHHGARTAAGNTPANHAGWQGRWFSRRGTHDEYPDFYERTGYGTGAGLCGWNCRHSFFPVIEGLSDPAYSAQQLRELNARTVTFDGEEMSLYDATQRQRYIERQIRRWKREESAMSAAGLDGSAAKDKIREWQARQRDFVKQTGLTRDYFRERAGKQNLESPSRNDIIKAQLRAVGVSGTIRIPRQYIDVSTLDFDNNHINIERGHAVTEAEAKSYIETALFSVYNSRWKSENYFSVNGAAYVQVQNRLVRTSFSSADYSENVRKWIEVFSKYDKK